MSEQSNPVSVNCRAPRGYGQATDRSSGSKGCGGKQAIVVMKTKLPTGGQSIRYQCLNCNQYFSINF